MQRFLHELTLLEETLFVLDTRLQVLLPALRVLLLMMLFLVISAERFREELNIHRFLALGPDLDLPPEVHTEQELGRNHL